MSERGPGWLVIDVGAVGVRLQVSAVTAERIGRVGQDVDVYTYLAMSQFGVSLYGFATPDERELFEGLIGVTGINPKSALAILSATSVDELTSAIGAGDVERLAKVPGLGRKSASRVILELKGKLPEVAVAGAPGGAAGPDADVIAALVGLGYSQTEAVTAAASVSGNGELSVEERIRLALGYFAGQG